MEEPDGLLAPLGIDDIGIYKLRKGFTGIIEDGPVGVCHIRLQVIAEKESTGTRSVKYVMITCCGPNDSKGFIGKSIPVKRVEICVQVMQRGIEFHILKPGVVMHQVPGVDGPGSIDDLGIEAV